MIHAETAAMIGISWTLGAVTGWGLAFFMVLRARKRRCVEKHALRDAFVECDGCGQITSEHKGGLCPWCERTYRG